MAGNARQVVCVRLLIRNSFGKLLNTVRHKLRYALECQLQNFAMILRPLKTSEYPTQRFQITPAAAIDAMRTHRCASGTPTNITVGGMRIMITLGSNISSSVVN